MEMDKKKKNKLKEVNNEENINYCISYNVSNNSL